MKNNMASSFKFYLTYQGQTQSYRISANSKLVIGRSNESGQLPVDHPSLSRKHLAMYADPNGLRIEDLGSTNGSYLNGKKLLPGQQVPFNEGDTLALTPDQAVVVRLTHQEHVSTSPPSSSKKGNDITSLLSSKREVVIGRSPDCDLVLEDVMVSRRHARLQQKEGKVWIEDLNSSNGVYVNGKKITSKQVLSDKDKVRIGLYSFSLGGTLLDLKKEYAISASNITKVFSNGHTGLQATTIKFPYREFIALMGPSGCGKSTLLKALNGDSPPTRGSIKLFDLDLHDHFDLVKHIIGYVPQENIVHEELTVQESLFYAAKIRLPEDTSNKEIDERIKEVLSSLKIDTPTIRKTKIAKLSGGQKKRVSIAVELLTKPKILFLDEPTSPLDPETIEEFLSCIRQLCKEGTTVIMVTHKPEDLNYVDRVVFMGVNGHLSYDGTKEGLLKHYNKETLIQLYALLSHKEEAKQWYDRWYSGSKEAGTAFKKIEIRRSSANVFYQTAWLTQRYFRIKIANGKNLLLLLIQPIFIAILIALSFSNLIEQDEIFGPQPKIGVLFLMAIAAIWFGVSNSAKEIVGEKDVAKREFRVNVLLFPYLISKQLVLFLLSAVQTFIFLVILMLVYPDLENFILLYGILLVLSMCAIQFGLMLSSLTQTTEEVMSLLPIALMPQIILSGILQPLESYITMFLSYFTIGRWGTELLARVQDLGQDNKIFLDTIRFSLYPENLNALPTDAFIINIFGLFIVFLFMLMIVLIALYRRISPKNS
ncbi:MAG: FHA domain-containing protein [Cyclobacteriaceae bacterium]|nr:FHA domain-containing protein [Cyclobacteriaceae bacterium]